jgi:hypothetical protein
MLGCYVALQDDTSRFVDMLALSPTWAIPTQPETAKRVEVKGRQ